MMKDCIKYIYKTALFSSLLNVLFIITVCSPIHAKADTLTYFLDYQFATYGNPPAGTTPWLTAVFDDSFGGSDTVRLFMTATNLTAEEYVSQWYFNIDPYLDASLLTFSPVDLTAVQNGDPKFDWDVNDVGTMKKNDINTGNDLWNAGGDGMYDFVFNFPTLNVDDGAYRFTTGETVVVDITFTGGDIDVRSFDFFSSEKVREGIYNTAAHVQNIAVPQGGCNDPDAHASCSGWISNQFAGVIVPEPVSSTLFIIGAGVLAGLQYNKRKKE